MLLNNEWITEDINKKRNLKIPGNENKNKTIQNLWDAAKAVLREKFIVLQAYLRKEKKKTSNKQRILTPKRTRKGRTKKNPK